jgi:predicted nucleotidyltransferase
VAEATAAVRRIVRRYEQELKRMGYPSEQVLLFGSQALGTAEEGSDIDLLVISPAWFGLSERERLEILGVAAARVLEPIQARGATREEIETGRLSSFLRQVLKEQAVAIL